MAARSQAYEDVWDFGNASGAVPLDSSSGSSSDEEDEKPAPRNQKRRKSEHVHVPDLVVLDESSGESDSDLDIVQTMERRRAKKKGGLLDDLELQIKPASKKAAKSAASRVTANPIDAAVSLKMKHSLQQLQALKSQLDSATQINGTGHDSDGNDTDKEDAEPAVAEKIIVKIRWAGKDEPVKLRIANNLPFARLFESFSKVGCQKGIFEEGADLKFVFDGEVIQPEQTAEELDIEDDCVIEVSW